MKLQNIKNLSIVVFIDFISVTLFYLITKYFLRLIKGYYEKIQSLTPTINYLGLNLQQNASLLNINELGDNLDLIGTLSNKILILLFLLALISFLIYNISQSINWNLILNEFKLKNYKNYLKRFTLINIPLFLISIYLLFKIITRLRPFILDFWFGNYFDKNGFLIIFLSCLVLLYIVYLVFLIYIYLNKHDLMSSLNIFKREFYKKPINFFIFLIFLFISSVISIFILRINPSSIILSLFSLLIFLSIFNVFRIYLGKKVDQYFN